jgi:hypothetical protein
MGSATQRKAQYRTLVPRLFADRQKVIEILEGYQDNREFLERIRSGQ